MLIVNIYTLVGDPPRDTIAGKLTWNGTNGIKAISNHSNYDTLMANILSEPILARTGRPVSVDDPKAFMNGLQKEFKSYALRAGPPIRSKTQRMRKALVKESFPHHFGRRGYVGGSLPKDAAAIATTALPNIEGKLPPPGYAKIAIRFPNNRIFIAGNERTHAEIFMRIANDPIMNKYWHVGEGTAGFVDHKGTWLDRDWILRLIGATSEYAHPLVKLPGAKAAFASRLRALEAAEFRPGLPQERISRLRATLHRAKSVEGFKEPIMLLVEHLPGKHDQKTHGHRGVGLAKKAIEQGGFTYNPVRLKDRAPTEGFAVSLRKDAEKMFDVKDRKLLKEQIVKYVHDHKDDIKAPGNFLGGWHDVDNGKIYLDISKVFKDRNQALREAATNKQLAVYDLKSKQVIPVERKAA